MSLEFAIDAGKVIFWATSLYFLGKAFIFIYEVAFCVALFMMGATLGGVG